MAHHVHSLNNSPAKQKYSFSKQERFVYKKPLYYFTYLELKYSICPKSKRIIDLLLWAMVKDRWEILIKRCTKIPLMDIAYLPPFQPIKDTHSWEAEDMYILI
jgi:hypothetical protein